MKSMGRVMAALMVGMAVGLAGCATPGGEKAFRPKLDGKLAGVEIVPAVALALSAVRPDLAPYLKAYVPQDKNGNPVQGIEPQVALKWVGEARTVGKGDEINEADIRRFTTWVKEERLSSVGMVTVNGENTAATGDTIDLTEVTPEQIAEAAAKLDAILSAGK